MPQNQGCLVTLLRQGGGHYGEDQDIQVFAVERVGPLIGGADTDLAMYTAQEMLKHITLSPGSLPDEFRGKVEVGQAPP